MNPAYLEKELTSMATSLAPSISKMDLGTPVYRYGQQRKTVNHQEDVDEESLAAAAAVAVAAAAAAAAAATAEAAAATAAAAAAH